MLLSLIIPAYNEATTIASTLEHVQDYLRRQPYDAEVIVVDDGSTDDTAAIVRERFPRVTLMSYRPNRGKGHAVKTGMLEGRGTYRVFYDADASTPIEELEKLWPRFAAGAEIVIGSRSLPDSQIEVRQAWYRESMGRVFNVIERILGLTHMPDTQCGFKGFTARAADDVFNRQTLTGFSFDAELLYIAERHGFRVDQVPVRWANRPQTRVRAVRDSLRMFRDLLIIRWRAWCGAYR